MYYLKKIFAMILLLLVCGTMQAQHRSESIQDIRSKANRKQVNKDNVIHSVEYFVLGDYAFAIIDKEYAEFRQNYQNQYKGDIVIPESVEYNDVTYPVKSIQRDAFNNCKDVTSITLPNSLKQIGSTAFMGTSLTSLIIPEGVEKIDNMGLSVGPTLKSVQLPVHH